MVQIIPMSRTPGMGEAIGSGFARGVNQGIEEGNYEKRLGMHAKLTDMMQQQKQTREGKAFLEAMGPEILKAYGLDPERIDQFAPLGQAGLSTIMKQKAEMESLKNLIQADIGDRPSQLNKIQQQPRREPQQDTKALPAGRAPMLNYEDIPAEEEPLERPQREQPRYNIRASQNQPKKNEPEISDIRGEVERIKQESENNLLKARTPAQVKQIQAIRDKKIDQALKISEAESKFRKTEVALKDSQTRVARETEQKDVQTFVNESQQQASKIPNERALLDIAQSSLKSGNFGLLSWDNIADKTGIDAFRTGQGEAFRTAVKHYFLDETRGLGKQGNMFMEKFISSILPNVGKTPEANMAWLEMEKMRLDNVEKKQSLIEELTPYNTDSNGVPSRDLINSVNKEMLEYGKKNSQKYIYRAQGLTAEEINRLDKVEKGTLLTEKKTDAILRATKGDKKKAIQVAKALGYTIPNPEIVNE
jgi:hypothetical protein